MRNQRYVDTSDLFAPYDQAQLQGLGFWEGFTLPRDTYSADTIKLQELVNAELKKKGCQPIPTDGVLGQMTCAAMKQAGIKNLPDACASGFSETSYSCGGGQVQLQTTPKPAEQKLAEVKVAAKSSDNTTLIVAAGLSILGLAGLVVYLRSRR
jgi:hypothetical protein